VNEPGRSRILLPVILFLDLLILGLLGRFSEAQAQPLSFLQSGFTQALFGHASLPSSAFFGDVAFAPDGDVYAPEAGFSDGLPVARSASLHRSWLAHCYGMVGVGRDLDVQSGSGAELYVVIGHAPRHLDRNVALVGRVVKGMELLSALPRGSGQMGFYAKAEAPTPIKSIRVAADVPQAERSKLEVLRTDSPTFTALIESRRNRPEDFFMVPAGHIDLCNVPIAVREQPAAAAHSP